MLPRSTCRPRCCRPNLSLCPVIWFWIAGFFHSTKYYVFQHLPFNQLLGLYECAPVIGQTRTFVFTGKFLVFLFSLGCRSPPSDFGFSFSKPKQIEIGGIHMKKINLREYYPFYTTDTIVEVPDEVADILRAYKLRDEAYRIYTYRHKAYFSLDFGDGIEYEALVDQKSPADIYEQHRVTEMIYKGLATLSEKQRHRIYAHYFLGMSQTEIARVENCSKISVHQSINRGLKQLQEYFLKNNL